MTELAAAAAADVAASINSSMFRHELEEDIVDAAAAAAAAAAEAAIAKSEVSSIFYALSTTCAVHASAGRFFSIIRLMVGAGEAVGVFVGFFLFA